MQRKDVERLLAPRLFLDGDGDLCCEREGHNLVACPAVSDEHPWPLLNADVWQNIPAMQEALRALLDRAERAEAERDAAYRAGYRDGFSVSGAGANQEYPWDQYGRDPEQDECWLAERESLLAKYKDRPE